MKVSGIPVCLRLTDRVSVRNQNVRRSVQVENLGIVRTDKVCSAGAKPFSGRPISVKGNELKLWVQFSLSIGL